MREAFRPRQALEIGRQALEMDECPADRWRATGFGRTGVGLEFVLAPDGSVLHYYKYGGNVGVCALMRHYPAEGLDVAMLSNATYGGGAAIKEIDRVIRAS